MTHKIVQCLKILAVLFRFRPGNSHSLFQSKKEEIFVCGNNEKVHCGLNYFYDPQITPSRIHNAPSNMFNLFADIYFNAYGSLGKYTPTQTISCANSSY